MHTHMIEYVDSQSQFIADTNEYYFQKKSQHDTHNAMCFYDDTICEDREENMPQCTKNNKFFTTVHGIQRT